ncbi:aspartic peptidase domain-containing protein [Pyronema omphalodes]|nr:aspartic peptidase domain-containing protein [Pyronema omphalodes]
MRYHEFLVLLAGVVLVIADCSVKPFTMQYGIIKVMGGSKAINAFHKSLAFGIGNPLVTFGIRPAATLNSTFISASESICNSSAAEFPGCLAWRGGLFDMNSSSTWVSDTRTTDYYNGTSTNDGWDFLNRKSYQSASGKLEKDPIAQFPRGWDTVVLGEAAKAMKAFPLSIVNLWYFPFSSGMVGLATNSIFLKLAVAAGISPSRSWGLDYGEYKDGKDQPGEMVFGGYDARKAVNLTKYPVFPDKSKPCPFQVTVKSMKWGNKNMMDGQAPFLACVEPGYWTNIMPLQVQKNWNKTMTAAGYAPGNDNNKRQFAQDWEYLYMNKTNGVRDFPKEDMEIELDGGFKVKIPNRELWGPAQVIDDVAGTRDNEPDVTGVRVRILVGNAGYQDAEPAMAFLGQPFLSQVYLAADYENNVFYLAPTQRGDPNQPAELKTLGCDGNTTANADSNSNTAAIAGGVVGGIAGLAIIAGLVWFLFFRQKKEHEPVSNPEQQQDQYNSGKVDYNVNNNDVLPRYSSPIQQNSAYYPSPSEGTVSAMNSPYPYQQSAEGSNWGAPQRPVYQLDSNAIPRTEIAELGSSSAPSPTVLDKPGFDQPDSVARQ